MRGISFSWRRFCYCAAFFLAFLPACGGGGGGGGPSSPTPTLPNDIEYNTADPGGERTIVLNWQSESVAGAASYAIVLEGVTVTTVTATAVTVTVSAADNPAYEIRPLDDDDNPLTGNPINREVQAAMNCIGQWNDYSQCADGMQTRSYAVTTPAQFGGTACPASETQPCADCDGSYEAWSACSGGRQTRDFVATTDQLGEGTNACPAPETQSCADCAGDYGVWGSCSGGSQTRDFVATTPQSGEGTDACPASETQSCADCAGDYGVWGACSGGMQTRDFVVTTPQSGEGTRTCSESETQSCADCAGDYGAWGSCSGGMQTRDFVATTPQSGEGTLICPAPETRPCTDCKGDYGDWGECQPDGMRTRAFVVSEPAQGDGQCPMEGMTQSEPCTYTPPVADVDCAGHYVDSGSCSAPCGGGTQLQSYVITTPQSGNGRACAANSGDANPNPPDCNIQACPLSQSAEPIIVVSDSGVQPELFAHAPGENEVGGYFVNREVQEQLQDAAADADAIPLVNQFYGPTDGRTAGNHAWANPDLEEEGYSSFDLNTGFLEGSTFPEKSARVCFNPNGKTNAERFAQAVGSCEADEITLIYTFRAGGIYRIEIEYTITHGSRVSGAILALREDARLLSRRVDLRSPTGADEGAADTSSAFMEFQSYNDWAAKTGADKLRIFSNSFNIDHVFSPNGATGCDGSNGNAFNGVEPYAVLCKGAYNNISQTMIAVARLMNNRSSKDVLLVFAGGNDPSPFPELEAMLPIFDSRDDNGDLTVSRCVSKNGDACPGNPQATLGEIWPGVNSPYQHRGLKERFIAAAGASVEDSKSPDGFDIVENNDEAERYAVFERRLTKCGIAKEWCLAALALDVPVTTETGILWHFTTPPLQLYGEDTELRVEYGGKDDTARFAGEDTAEINGPSPYFDGTSAATPRIAAAAAGVMRESGMTEGDATQKVLFKTAFKCQKPGAENKPSAGVFAPDATLANILVADCDDGGSSEYQGYTAMTTDLSGQGLLNYVGALEEAGSISVAGANGEGASRLAAAAFNVPEYFGDGVAAQLAAIDLDLVAASGNRYRHRPLPGGLARSSFARDNAERVFAFGAKRIAAPANALNGVGGHSSFYAHSQTPFRLAEERGALSGFSYQSGGFSFAFDEEELPNRFAAGATLLPEAGISPYLDFARKGMELSYDGNGGGDLLAGFGGGLLGEVFADGVLSFAAARGGREDTVGGESEAVIGVAAYEREVGDFKVNVSLGALREDNRLLGVKSGGAFAVEGALTRFAGLRAEWGLGGLFDLTRHSRFRGNDGDGGKDDNNSGGANDGAEWTLYASLWRGLSRARAGASAIFADDLIARSESYALGINGANVFARDDELTFSVYHPLRVYGGNARLSLPLDRAGESQRDDLDLAARAREFDFAIGYRRRLGDGGDIALGAMFRLHPAHREDAKAESIAAASLSFAW